MNVEKKNLQLQLNFNADKMKTLLKASMQGQMYKCIRLKTDTDQTEN